MKTIRIKNLRSLKDTGDIQLKPITMLVGANSSGKSTFLRTFPLFKQGIGVNKQGPILWYGNEVDFGSYEEALRRDANMMQFSFKWDNLQYDKRYYGVPYAFEDGLNIDCSFDLASSGYNSYVRNIYIKVNQSKVELHFSIQNRIEIFVDGEKIDSLFSYAYKQYYGAILPIINIRPTLGRMEENDDESYSLFYYDTYLHNVLPTVEILSELIGDTDYDAEIQDPFCSSEDVLNQIINICNISLTEEQRAAVLQSPSWKAFKCGMIAYYVDDVLSAIDKALQSEFNSCVYIKPFRAYAERYYRIQNLAVRNLDSDGHNMAMICDNMSRQRNGLKDFNEWTENHFKFSVKVRRSRGHVSLLIKENDAADYCNITDKGFGYSQVLPIILSLWQVLKSMEKGSSSQGVKSKIIAFEQPELHLHPKLQAMIMDVIIAISNSAREYDFDLKFIIETHSSVMINRLGLRIAGDNSLRDKAAVLVFNEMSQENPSISTYDNAGHLLNWPLGFFEPDL